MNFIVAAVVLILTILTIFYSLRIYLNIVKYKEGALGLIFTHLKDSILYFRIYAIAILILGISRFMDVVNIYQLSSIADFATILVLVTDALMVIVFYKLSVITNLEKSKE